MADSDAFILGIENNSSLTWSAPERYEQDLEKLANAAQHHLYLVVIGPKLTPTAVNAMPDSSGWTLDITYGTPEGPKPYSIEVPKTAFPRLTLSFDDAERVLTLVPESGNGEVRKITVAQVVREAIKGERSDGVDATVDELFTFKVVYIGQSYGRKNSSTAIKRLTGGHETVEKILSDTQDYSQSSAVAFITIDQRLTSVGANIKMNQGDEGVDAVLKLATERFAGIVNEPLSKRTVDAAEAALITAFQPQWNIDLKDFTQKGRPTLMTELKEDGYTHLHIHINLNAAHAKVRGPLKGVPSSHHSWTFNLDTGAIENPSNGSWLPRNTDF
ncbi:hypothetical protein I6N91_06550 [Arthrobacter sp. MSA 4-2]|uniref:hypothetical protein n=1 Tax=Arthrobacter sp. MSA 4-2 TaxID=2794349 RepID=UPI0018E88442|nr:hypothetical protein [Arthrobacter sp. MSA 4-2]MBJ2120639.1 hypothetical protein [Arthrobacter sp. MSA 4-2]